MRNLELILELLQHQNEMMLVLLRGQILLTYTVAGTGTLILLQQWMLHRQPKSRRPKEYKVPGPVLCSCEDKQMPILESGFGWVCQRCKCRIRAVSMLALSRMKE